MTQISDAKILKKTIIKDVGECNICSNFPAFLIEEYITFRMQPTNRQMKKVTLQFESLKALIDFTLQIDIKNCIIDETHYRLTCVLDESQIELAKEGFNATLTTNEAD